MTHEAISTYTYSIWCDNGLVPHFRFANLPAAQGDHLLTGISLPKSDLTLVSRCQATLDLYVYMSSESISIIDGEKVFV